MRLPGFPQDPASSGRVMADRRAAERFARRQARALAFYKTAAWVAVAFALLVWAHTR